jgi:membrane-associated phospholipid phosphatase
VPGRRWGPALLPVAGRRPAAALAAVCVTVTAVLAVSFAHQSRADWLDAAVDARIQAALGGHPLLLTVLPWFGDKLPVAVMTGALVVACLVTRRWRGAALAGTAMLTSGVITEHVLKPLTGRGFPSGHATSTFALAAICAVLLAGPSRPRLPAAVRLFLALAAVLVAGAASAAMVALQSHYFTDIIGGAAVSVATVLLIALVLDRFIPAVGTGTGDTRQAGDKQPAPTMRLASSPPQRAPAGGLGTAHLRGRHLFASPCAGTGSRWAARTAP